MRKRNRITSTLIVLSIFLLTSTPVFAAGYPIADRVDIGPPPTSGSKGDIANNVRNNTVIENKDVIRIGVPGMDEEFYKYDILKDDLENRLNLKIEYIELDANSKSQDDYIENIDSLLKDNKVDMCLGVPSYQLEKIINNDRLLDLTDSIWEIDKIHKGVINISEKMGDGNLYFISPVISSANLVFQNELILNELNDELPTYVSWNEFLEHLDKNQNTIDNQNLKYSPIPLAIKDVGDDNLFIGYEFSYRP